MDKPGQHPRELNPYWKDGGTGLPIETKSNKTPCSFEGQSWLLRSYKRALEEAKETNVPFDKIATKRWGSVEKIYSLLQSAGIDPSLLDGSSSHTERSLLYSRSKYDEGQKREQIYTSSNLKMLPTRCESLEKPFLRPGDEGVNLNDEKLFHDSNKHAWKIKQQGMSKLGWHMDDSKPNPTTSSSQSDYVVTETMINAASAKFIKAELTGNAEKMKKYQLELEDLRSKKKLQDSTSKLQDQSQSKKSREKVVLLTETDKFGHVRPAEVPVLKGEYKSKKGKSKWKYDSDDSSLKSVIEQERRLTADDTYEAIARMASKFVRSNPEDVVDDVLDRNTKSDPFKEKERIKQKVYTESRKMEEMLDKCKYCVDSTCFPKHLLVAMGINTYLCAPPHQSLTEGHCMIVPLHHSPCFLQLDENVVSEIKIFQKGLTKMFSDNNMDAMFTECYTSSSRKSHMYIECIPVPKSEGSMAPMYFKKAILESDAEWAQNKKLIDTRSKELRKVIPLGLPYFFVDFNNQGGFAHVIEESSLFPHYFAKEVIGGLIDAEPRLWLKSQFESREQQTLKTLKISEMWKPYDWTRRLK